MPERVAETTTGSDSGNWSPSAVVDSSRRSSAKAESTMSAARTENAALIKLTKTKHNGRIRITSFLQLESRTCLSPKLRKAHRPALILLFAKKFFRGPSRTGTYQRFGFAAQPRTQFLKIGSSTTLANEVERSNILAPGVKPSSRLHRSPWRSIGLGKSYPVTAAQLLPVSTGFLAPIHFSFSSSQR